MKQIFFLFIILFKIYYFHIIYPKISIIIPIFNAKNYLVECLNSIVNQTLKEIEIICINDGSNDNSLEIIFRYSIDNRIIIIDKPNTGYGDSMNIGLDFSIGEYIGIIEPDDFADVYMFEYLYKFTENGIIDIVSSNYIYFWNKKKKKSVQYKFMKSMYNKIINPIEFPFIFLINPAIWSRIYKADMLIKNNIRFLATPGASYQDTSFFLKTIFKSNNIFYINKHFLYYRQTNPNSSVHNKSLKKRLYLHRELKEADKYLKKDLKRFYKIEKYYNTRKIMSLIWNLNKIEKKDIRNYMKILYNYIYNILNRENYLYNRFKKFDLKILNYLKNYGDEITSDIFIYSKSYNLTKPKISIVIIINKNEKLIEKCFKSLIKQTFKNFEIICINNNINNSYKLNKIELIDKRVHIYKLNFSEIEKARNFGKKESKGEYLMFLEPNNVFEITMLEKFYIKIKKSHSNRVIY